MDNDAGRLGSYEVVSHRPGVVKINLLVLQHGTEGDVLFQVTFYTNMQENPKTIFEVRVLQNAAAPNWPPR
jgi:hypothetical protein